MNKIIFLAIICFIFTVQLYGVSLETFKATSYTAESDKPILLGEAVPFTADDGTLFYLQEVNSLYAKQKTSEELLLKYYSPGGWSGPQGPRFTPIANILDDEEGVVAYGLLCESKGHILFVFKHYKYFFVDKTDDYTVDINKQLDFENITTYTFTLKYKNIIQKIFPPEREPLPNIKFSVDVWTDKNYKYCGSFMYPPYPFLEHYSDLSYEVKTIDQKTGQEVAKYIPQYKLCIDIDTGLLNEYYVCVKDFYIDFAEQSLKFHLEGSYKWHTDFRENFEKILYLMKYCDNDTWEIFNDKFKNASEIVAANRRYTDTVSRLKNYTLGVSSIIERNQYRLEYIPKNIPAFEFPRTAEELNEYMMFIKGIYDPAMRDYYGVEIKIELHPRGLKATSAGPDKVFDTDDDIVFIREHEPIAEKEMDEE